jgi:hypothetical protein
MQGRYWQAKHFAPLTNIRTADFTIQLGDRVYHSLDPVKKNFESQKIGIALNRQMRVHRISLISMLYGLGLDAYCNVSAMHLHKQLDKLDSDEYLDHSDWHFDPKHDAIKTVMQKGFKHIVNLYHQGINFRPPAQDIYPTMPGTDTVIEFNNASNFDRELRPLYNNTFVEFISGRTYSEPTTNLDEKITNAVYGQNFPIVIGTPGTVKLYRQSGLDMFDDVVDHSYDTIANPIDRMYRAVVSNQHLITNPEYTKQLWKNCQERFEKNIAYSRLSMYNYFEDYIFQDCNRNIPDLLKNKFDERSRV